MKVMAGHILPATGILVLLVAQTFDKSCVAETSDTDLDDPHRAPSLCEVCKFLTTELKERLAETGKTKDVIETGYSIDKTKKTKKYKNSELRLIEAVTDPHVCEKIMEYQVHAERKGSLRFAKGRSQTMETLHNLVDKGVNVELGIPYELWDQPSAGVSEMQRVCYKIVEEYEEDIEEWYYNSQDEDLTSYLCQERVLRHDDNACLSEKWQEKKKDEEKENKKKKSSKSSKSKKEKSKPGLKGETGDGRDEL